MDKAAGPSITSLTEAKGQNEIEGWIKKITKCHPLIKEGEPKATVKSLTLGIQNVKVMDINTERTLLIKELQQVEDISLLKTIKAVLHYGLKNEGRISVEQYNRELEEAEGEIDRGEFITHEELKKQMKAW